jgi:NADH:ubiquinone oxidoreductase subunit E
MLVNERVYGQVTPERADEILAEYSAMEDENADD